MFAPSYKTQTHKMIGSILHTLVIVGGVAFVAKDALLAYRSRLKAAIAAVSALGIMSLLYRLWGIWPPILAFLYYCHNGAARERHFIAVANYFAALWVLVALYHLSIYTDGNFLYMLALYTYVIVAYRHYNARYRDECGALTMALLTLLPLYAVVSTLMYLCFTVLAKL